MPLEFRKSTNDNSQLSEQRVIGAAIVDHAHRVRADGMRTVAEIADQSGCHIAMPLQTFTRAVRPDACLRRIKSRESDAARQAHESGRPAPAGPRLSGSTRESLLQPLGTRQTHTPSHLRL